MVFIPGNDNNNVLTGTADSDEIRAYGGTDQLFGLGGVDYLYGGYGQDWLDGGEGADVMDGGEDWDTYVVDNVYDVVKDSGTTDENNLVLVHVDHYQLPANANIQSIQLVEGSAARTFYGNGESAQFTGNSYDNVFYGGSGQEEMYGQAGNDALVGGAGNDTLYGDGSLLATTIVGNDSLDGGIGDDVMFGGKGDDSFTVDSVGDSIWEFPGEGTDTVFSYISYELGSENSELENLVLYGTADLTGVGTQLANVINGNLGNNALYGWVGDDQLYGYAGNDTLDGGSGYDYLEGGTGDDTYYVDTDLDRVRESAGGGCDRVLTTATFTLHLTLAEVELLKTTDDAGTTAINLTGSNTANELIGNAGTNILNGRDGADTMHGLGGNDSYVVDNAGDTVAENANEGTDTVSASIDYRLPVNVENLILTGSADLQGYGNSSANTIIGNAGSNILNGLGGADAMLGGAGNDFYFVDDASDSVSENAGEGNDTVFSTANFTLSANVETLVLQGGADLQGYGNSQANVIYGNAGSNVLNGFGGADLMVGGAGSDNYFVDEAGDAAFEVANEGNDTVFTTANYGLAANVENLVMQGGADLQGYGSNQANVIYGNTGNNLINGAGGADLMVGGVGNDTYFVDDSSDACFEVAGQGSDAVFASCNYGLAAEVETLVMQGSGDFQGYGSNQANTIYGNGGNNLINGAGGADIMAGGAGNDTYFVDNAGDVVVENPGEGTDVVFSTVHFILPTNVEALVLQGLAAANGTGNALTNSIFGNSGANVLDGQGGTDTLTGNAGNDTFVFHAGQGNGDAVVDFAGNGALAGDSLQFVGYGPGATFTNIDATHWQVNFNGSASHEVITFMNGASIDATDVVFM
jgi:trimeric autotransporter adhesin